MSKRSVKKKKTKPDDVTLQDWIKRIFEVATIVATATPPQKHKTDKVRYGNEVQNNQSTE